MSNPNAICPNKTMGKVSSLMSLIRRNKDVETSVKSVVAVEDAVAETIEKANPEETAKTEVRAVENVVVVAAAEAAMTDVKVVADTKDAVAKAEAVEEEFVAKDSMKMVKSLMELKPVATVKATREKLAKMLTQWTDIPELAVERETTADKVPVLDGVTMPTRTQLPKLEKAKKRPREEMASQPTPVKDANAALKKRKRLLRKNQRKR